MKFKPMKAAFLLLFVLSFAFSSHAQDTLRKKDGTVMIGIVKEISDTELTFVREDQPDGPLRRIGLHEISSIVYKDGTREIFNVSAPQAEPTRTTREPEKWEPGTVNTTDHEIHIKRRGRDIHVPPGERVPVPGEIASYRRVHFYLEGMLGYSEANQKLKSSSSSVYSNPLGHHKVTAGLFGIRAGLNWYPSIEKPHRYGLNIQFARIVGFIDFGLEGLLFTPLNPGFSGSIRLGDKSRMEINTTLGIAFSNFYERNVGYILGADLKYRYRSFGIGFDYSHSRSFTWGGEYIHLYSLVVGVKFG